jgi:hypothetical protein
MSTTMSNDMSKSRSAAPHQILTLPILALACMLSAAASGHPSPHPIQTASAADIPTIEAIDGMSTEELRQALKAIAATRERQDLSAETRNEAKRAFDHLVARLRSDSPSDAPPAPQNADAESTRYKRLVGLRAGIVSVNNQLSSPDLTAEERAELRRDLSVLNDQMRQFADECSPATERIPVDQAFLMVASRAQSLFENFLRQNGRSNNAVEFYIDSVEADLHGSLSSVDLELERPLSMVRVSGWRWEVEEAKRALRDALPAYIARMEELIDAEERVLSERQREQGRTEELLTVNIDWKGGTLQELVTSVKSLVECNVVLADATVGGLTIPALAVKRVAPEVFFLSLQSLPLDEDAQIAVTVIAPDAANGGKPAEVRRPGEVRRGQNEPIIATSPVIMIARKPVSAADSPSASVRQRIFDLSDWPGADAKGIKSLIEAIDFALQADGSADRVKARYHEPSRILFAKGPSGSIDLIDEIVTAFRNKK